MQSKNYVCERCNGMATICHHKEHISETNIDDPMVTLNQDNLSALCHDCHNRVHGNNEVVREGLKFDADGNIVQAP